MDISLKLDKGFWYVASPYSKYPHGLDEAFRRIAINTAELILEGVPVYSPICHTHPIAKYGKIDPYNHDIWLPADKPMMDAAYGLLVIKMVGWEESYGISEEIKHFTSLSKPIVYMEDQFV